ncbi:MAG: anthranilate phosphoribosyltransferase, partial [Rhizobiaceae bacterium]|nr:anthranilate phosphoribosyltransferase [Rhizobiaceae bacterium]
NAAASLMVADKVSNLKDGVAMARESITSGSANTCLDKLVAASNQGIA